MVKHYGEIYNINLTGEECATVEQRRLENGISDDQPPFTAKLSGAECVQIVKDRIARGVHLDQAMEVFVGVTIDDPYFQQVIRECHLDDTHYFLVGKSPYDICYGKFPLCYLKLISKENDITKWNGHVKIDKKFITHAVDYLASYDSEHIDVVDFCQSGRFAEYSTPEISNMYDDDEIPFE